MDNISEMKALKKRINDAEAEADVLASSIRESQRELSRKQTVIRELQQRLDQLTPKEIVVSDHAVLRYIERCGYVDLDAIRESIKTAPLVNAINTLGNGKFPLHDENGLRAVVKDKVIVTIY